MILPTRRLDKADDGICLGGIERLTLEQRLRERLQAWTLLLDQVETSA